MIEKDEWFPDVGEYLPENGNPPNPLDSMPIARYHDWEDTAPSEYEPPIDNRWAPPEKRLELESNPRPEEEVADWFTDKPEEKEETIHEKMYKIATARYNPFSVGGSENCDSDISCNIGGSEQHIPPRPEEEIYDDLNDPYGGH